MVSEKHNLERLKSIPLTQINDRPFDYKKRDKTLDYKLSRSIEKFGQIEMLLVARLDGQIFIVDGQKRKRLFKELGYDNVLVVDYGETSMAQMIVMCLVVNEYEYMKDYVEISKLLHQAHKTLDEKESHAILPYNREELDQLITLLDFSWDKLSKKNNSDEQQIAIW